MTSFTPKSIFITGRQAAISVAELESLFGADHILPIDGAVLMDIETDEIDINFNRLGGTLKIGNILATLPTTNWQEIADYLINNAPVHTAELSEGRITMGLSVYGRINTTIKAIQATLLTIKKSLKSSGRPARIIPNKTLELNTAQVLHNKLTQRGGWEFIIITDRNQTYLARTVFVQDIESYAARDQKRPKRDAQVGMLPPKLAQTIINLALDSNQNSTILDPFCGTGVILQEALLMGYDVIGTDLEPRMVEYSALNIEWLKKFWDQTKGSVLIESGDATKKQWSRTDFVIASETYLGRPLQKLPVEAEFNKITNDVNTILVKFLRNLTEQVPKGSRHCLAIPAWYGNNRYYHLPLLDQLAHLGYNRLSFVHAEYDQLIYHRPGQIVARELVVLEKS